MTWQVLMIALCIFISGCSATVIHKISANDETETGIRYYDSAPYLLVYSDGKNGLNWQIIYLPDQTHVMSANPQIIGGRTEMTLSFNSGVLTTASTVGDTTALPKALIAAVQTALPFLAETLKGPAPRAPGFPAPSLYRLVVSDGVLLFKGQQGDTKIQVPILMRPPS